MSQPAISVEDLSKQYVLGKPTTQYSTLADTLTQSVRAGLERLKGKQAPSSSTFWALRKVSFSVQPGEVMGIVGRNGAGKSTLLKVLSRITDPTVGRVRIRGRMASLLEVGTGFHAELSGRENVYLNGAILGMHRHEIERKFDEIVSFAEVEQFIDTPVKRYSSGMYLRLAFAVAAHLEPEILVVDEVLAVGDASFQKRCLGKMQDVVSQGRTVLFVSHNMAAVSKLCHRGLWLADGKVVGDGAAETIVRDYLASSESEAESNYVWLPADAAAKASQPAIQRALIRRDGSDAGGNIPFESPLFIDVEYNLPTAMRGLAVICRLTDSGGNILFTTWDTDGATPPPDLRAAGRHVSTCPLPASLLRPGTYSVAVGLHQYGRGWHHYNENALGFRISPQGYRFNENRVGLLTPAFDWEYRDAAPAAR